MFTRKRARPLQNGRGEACLARLIRYRVVALASLDLLVLVGHLKLEFPVGPVFLGIRWRVRNRVLSAHLVLDFLEEVVESVLAIHLEHAPAGFVRHLLQFTFPAAAKPKTT